MTPPDPAAPGPLVWVTRAEPGARRTADALVSRGYAALVAPLIATRPIPFAPPDLSAVDALAFTSLAGVEAFGAGRPGALPPRVPVYTVGDATAEAAKRAGFEDIHSAAGDAQALIALILRAQPAGARILHPVAARPAVDVAAALRAAGILATALPVYETTIVDRIPAAAAVAWDDGALGAILLHSPTAARALATITPKAPESPAVVALSEACAGPLRGLSARLSVAARPDEPALLDALDALRLHAAPGRSAADLGKRPPRR